MPTLSPSLGIASRNSHRYRVLVSQGTADNKFMTATAALVSSRYWYRSVSSTRNPKALPDEISMITWSAKYCATVARSKDRKDAAVETYLASMRATSCRSWRSTPVSSRKLPLSLLEYWCVAAKL